MRLMREKLAAFADDVGSNGGGIEMPTLGRREARFRTPLAHHDDGTIKTYRI